MGKVNPHSAFKATRKGCFSRRMVRQRRGAALIEFAVCIPFLTFIVLATIECTNFIFLRQATVQAAYEGAKKAINPQSSRADATVRVNEVFQGRNISNPRVTFTPNPDNANRGQDIVVTVSVPTNGNLLFNLPGFAGRNITVVATMVRE